MKIQKMRIKDSEFLRSYLEFNLSHRYIVAEACFKSFDKGNWAIKKSIGIEIIAQYIGLLEDIAMLYYAMKNKNRKSCESFLKILKTIFIKEKEGYGYTSEKIVKELDELEKINFDDFIKNVLHLPSKNYFKKIVPSELIKQFGGLDGAYNQYIRELKSILSNIKLAIRNRIRDKNNRTLPLKDVLNRIKHGPLFINDSSNEESVIFPINVTSLSSNETEIKFLNLICNNKSSLEKLIRQMKIITDEFKKILNCYYAYYFSES